MKVVVLRGITTKNQRFVPSKTDIPNVVDLDDAVADIFVRGGAAREANETDLRLSGYVEKDVKAKADRKPADKPKTEAKPDPKSDDPL